MANDFSQFYHTCSVNGVPVEEDFTIKRGNDCDITVIIYQANQTGATINFIAKPSIDLDDQAGLIVKNSGSGGGITTTISADSLVAVMSLPKALTKNLPADVELIYAFQRTLGGKDFEFRTGKMKIEPDILRTSGSGGGS